MAVILDTTSKSLIAVMSGAPATTQPDFALSYSTKTATGLTGVNAHGTLNGTSEVTLVSAPASSAQNVLVECSIYNADTASIIIFLKEADGATRRIKSKVTLPVNYTLHYERDSGWYVTDTNGNRMAAGVTLLPAANGGTGVANGANTTLTMANAAFSLLGGGASSSLTLPNAATTITGGGTLALGGFTLTVPATGTAALLGTANVFTAGQTISATTLDIAGSSGTIGFNSVGTQITFGFNGYNYITATAASAVLRVQSSGVSGVLEFSTNGVIRQTINSSGNIGFGTATFGTSAVGVLAIANGTAPITSPADAVQLYSADFAAGDARLYVRDETGVASPVALLGKAQTFTAKPTISQAVSAESMRFTYNSNENFYNYIYNAWDGATPDNNLLSLYISSASSTTAERARITGAGNFKLGGIAQRATTIGTNHLDIFDGTAPVGTLSNGISLYSTSGELRVMDAAGNATLLSPHDDEGNWIYDSVSPVTGKHLHVDMEKLVKALNDKFGWDFVKEYKI